MTPHTAVPRLRSFFCLGILLMTFGFLLLGLVACSTTVPAPIHAEVIAYDGNVQNAGIVSIDANGAVITPTKRAYHNSLIAIYGDARWTKGGLPVFPVPLVRDYGITQEGANFRITADALAKHTVMHQWFKIGRTPQ
jgi:hypothetical protein